MRINRLASLAWILSSMFSVVNAQPGDMTQLARRLSLDANAPANSLSESEKAAGWKLLFNGNNFSGWKIFFAAQPSDNWKIQEGAALTQGTTWDRDLATMDRYENFVWSVEWKNVDRSVNSGLIYHALDTLNAPSFATGPEFQILGKAARYYDAQPENRAGSCFNLIKATSGGINADGAYYDATQEEKDAVPAWNYAVIIVYGNHHEYWMNGVRIVSFELGNADYEKRKALSKWKNGGQFPNFGKFKNGHLVLQNHGAGAAFRNIKVRVLPDNAQESDVFSVAGVNLFSLTPTLPKVKRLHRIKELTQFLGRGFK